MQKGKGFMKSFDGLQDGTVVVNPIDGEMVVRYSDWFSETGERELCFESESCLWRGSEFNPTDWEVRK